MPRPGGPRPIRFMGGGPPLPPPPPPLGGPGGPGGYRRGGGPLFILLPPTPLGLRSARRLFILAFAGSAVSFKRVKREGRMAQDVLRFSPKTCQRKKMLAGLTTTKILVATNGR
mmetsp:Transcript_14840/g.42784  ORF Transcript_14840/g.42784 Transcript_14840/m.42784 type:complete len:114 (-) Transcript_14840:73-414(-)